MQVNKKLITKVELFQTLISLIIFAQKMKYIYITFSCLIILLITSYFFIPNIISNIIEVESGCKTAVLRRMLITDTGNIKKVSSLDFSLMLDDIQNPSLLLNVEGEKIYVSINHYSNAAGNNVLVGSYSLNADFNYMKKVKNFYLNYKFKNDLKAVLKDICQNCENKNKIYGGKIEEVRLQDSTLIFTKNVSDSFPDIKEIYNQIEKLLNYAKTKGAITTNFPMLNIRKSKINSKFEYSIALPVNKDLPAFESITPKRMLSGGKFLMMEVKGGGFDHISKMEINLENYLLDHSYNSPAIPFQSLVTNRLLENDSTKWVTKLFYPIF
jgi:hypothetical protein